MIPALIEGIQQPAYKEVRLAAAKALGEMKAEAKPAAGALQQAAQDKDPEVAKAAAAALQLLQ